MELTFKIENNSIPHIGIVEAYIHEAINQVTTIELRLVSEFELGEAECLKLIGNKVSICLFDTIGEQLKHSRFDGRIYEFRIHEHADSDKSLFRYQATIRPMLWDLNFMVRARSFPNKSPVDVVDDILIQLQKSTGFEFEANYQKKKAYSKRTQIIQNYSSDLEFLLNLLQEEGINYFFCADKSGEKDEFLKIADRNIFFDEIFQEGQFTYVAPYIPQAGLVGGYRVDRFETHLRAIPEMAVATTHLCEGDACSYKSKTKIQEGYKGEYHIFDIPGVDGNNSSQKAKLNSEYFQSKRITYEGNSNIFLFRPGEKFLIGDGHGNAKHNVLMTHLVHHFRQTDNSALSQNDSVEYKNYFKGTSKNADIRPEASSSKITTEPKAPFYSQMENSGDKTNEFDDKPFENIGQNKKILEILNELSRTRELIGVMEGEVIEDAKISDKQELVCKVKNERFPEGITVKIALSWLTKQGWISFLPRVGVHVYFQFVSGSGGQHEAVMLGYRPTAKHPLMNPKNPTDTCCLDTDDEEQVKDSKCSPFNKHRNAILGEKGVAEIAVVDGGEDSVFLSAKNRVSAQSDQSINISTNKLVEQSKTKNQKMGALHRNVSGNQNVTIKGKLKHSVNNSILMESKDEDIQLNGKKQIKALVTDEVYAVVNDYSVQTHAGKSCMKVKKDDYVCLSIGDMNTDGNGLEVNAKMAKLKVKDSEIDINSDGKIRIKSKKVHAEADEIIINGKKVIVKGKIDLN